VGFNRNKPLSELVEIQARENLEQYRKKTKYVWENLHVLRQQILVSFIEPVSLAEQPLDQIGSVGSGNLSQAHLSSDFASLQ
jgi:hypothetical protein